MNQQTVPDAEIKVNGIALYPVATLIDDDHVYQITEKAERYTVYKSNAGSWLEREPDGVHMGWLEYENASANDEIFKVILWLEEGGGKPI